MRDIDRMCLGGRTGESARARGEEEGETDSRGNIGGLEGMILGGEGRGGSGGGEKS